MEQDILKQITENYGEIGQDIEIKLDEDTCPLCRSEDVEYDDIEYEGGYAYQVVTCCECGASWTQVYSLEYIGTKNITKK